MVWQSYDSMRQIGAKTTACTIRVHDSFAIHLITPNLLSWQVNFIVLCRIFNSGGGGEPGAAVSEQLHLLVLSAELRLSDPGS